MLLYNGDLDFRIIASLLLDKLDGNLLNLDSSYYYFHSFKRVRVVSVNCWLVNSVGFDMLFKHLTHA